jgi:hypothetical protein
VLPDTSAAVIVLVADEPGVTDRLPDFESEKLKVLADGCTCPW